MPVSRLHDYEDELATTVYYPAEPTRPEPPPRMSLPRMSPPPTPTPPPPISEQLAVARPMGFAPLPVRPGSERRATTHQLDTVSVRRVPARLLGLGFAGCVLLGITVGAVIVLTGSSRVRAASAARAVPDPVIAPKVPMASLASIHIAPAVARPALVTVRVESNPPGATATLVDRGTSTLIGLTPVDAELDGSHRYEVVLELADHETQTVQLDPAKQPQVTVALIAVAKPTPAPAPVVTSARQRPVVAPARRAVGPTVIQQPAAIGTLVISSKPPTAIVIDGKATGLTTPQVALAVATGHHQITLTNAAEGINLTTEVDITAAHPTRLVQDFTR